MVSPVSVSSVTIVKREKKEFNFGYPIIIAYTTSLVNIKYASVVAVVIADDAMSKLQLLRSWKFNFYRASSFMLFYYSISEINDVLSDYDYGATVNLYELNSPELSQ